VREMENALNERETEREKLLQRLRQAKTGDTDGVKELQFLLKEKDHSIADLRKKHRQLKDLTAVSSRNQLKIAQLQDDVKEMKRRKVDLQKLLARERKDHAIELKRLHKDAVQRDRELGRWKKKSADQENEARKANLVAKVRQEEIGKLRAKYKDSEKRLRLLSVKRGVMAKAGIDPVMVGRRLGGTKIANNAFRHAKVCEPIDMNALREYFDEKVAEVVRKEAIVDKMAREWEEHFELTTQKEQLSNKSDGDSAGDEVQAINIQIQFKEDRIRRLAKQLGNEKNMSNKNGKDTTHTDLFLSDEKFSNLLKGMTDGGRNGYRNLCRLLTCFCCCYTQGPMLILH